MQEDSKGIGSGHTYEIVLKATQIAKVLNVKPETVRRWFRKGILDSSLKGDQLLINVLKKAQELDVLDRFIALAEGDIGQRYIKARASAINRWKNHPTIEPWLITLDEYKELILQPCHYCKRPLHPTGIGLDRINNDRGYSIDNVYPCCPRCNGIRGRHLSPEATQLLIDKLIELNIDLDTIRGYSRACIEIVKILIPGFKDDYYIDDDVEDE